MVVAPLRERKRARTRQALAEAAFRLFAEKGYDGTTVDEIAEAAEVSRRTFFRYFETKEAAFFAQHEVRLERFRELLDSGVGTPWERVKSACLAMAAVYDSEQQRFLTQHRVIESSRQLAAYDLKLDAEWEAAIVDALLPTGRPARTDRRRAMVVAGAVIGMVRAVLREWFERGGRGSLAELGAEAFELLEEGIG